MSHATAPGRATVFGFGAHSTIDEGPRLLDMARRADSDGLDLFSLSDHPYIGGRLDAYASIGFILGQTQHIAGVANVTNLPTRPAPVLARIETRAGHGAGRPTSKIIEEAADQFAFLVRNLHMKLPPVKAN